MKTSDLKNTFLWELTKNGFTNIFCLCLSLARFDFFTLIYKLNWYLELFGNTEKILTFETVILSHSNSPIYRFIYSYIARMLNSSSKTSSVQNRLIAKHYVCRGFVYVCWIFFSQRHSQHFYDRNLILFLSHIFYFGISFQ